MLYGTEHDLSRTVFERSALRRESPGVVLALRPRGLADTSGPLCGEVAVLCHSQSVVIVVAVSSVTELRRVARRYVDLLRVDSTLMCGAC